MQIFSTPFLNYQRLLTLLVLVLLSLASGNSVIAAEYPPNNDYGQQGDFLAKRGVDRGRTAILAPIGPVLLNLPETPGSSNKNVNLSVIDTAWDLSNLTNPRLIGPFNCDPNGQNCDNGQGTHAHAVYTRFVNGTGYLMGNFRYQEGRFAFYDPSQSSLSQQIRRIANINNSVSRGVGYAGLTSKFSAKDYWEYNTDILDDHLLLTLFGETMPQADQDKLSALGLSNEFPVWLGRHATDVWDHTQLTGVTGFPTFSGNLLVYTSDQQDTGMAIYDISGIDRNTRPALLSVYKPQLKEPGGRTVGLGGYWVEPYAANKMVFGSRNNSRRDYSAFYVVDFSDPSAPRLSCEIYFDQDRSTPADGDFHTNLQYVNFQDQYAFTDHLRIDITACETAYAAAKASDPDHIFSAAEISQFVYKFADTDNYCDSSQYFRPLGQVGLFGGYDLGPDYFVTLDQAVPDSGIGYYRWYVSNQSNQGASLSSSHGSNVYGVDREAGWQVGHTLRGPGGTSYRITNITRGTEQANFQGMCFFVTSDEADTTPPYVSGHRPLANQSNVPVDTMIHLHIPETLRSETVGSAIRVVRMDNNTEIPIEYQLGHTGTIAVFPLSDLSLDVNYRVEVSGIRDFMGNTMTPYSYTFSTGASAPPPPPPPVDNEPAPTFSGTPYYPNQSSQLACSAESQSNNLWAVNPDNDSVSVVNTQHDSDFELSAQLSRNITSRYDHPTSITRLGDRYAVTYRDSDVIVIYNSSGSQHRVIATGYGTQPISSVADDNHLYVSLYRKGVARNSVGDVTLGDYGEILKISRSNFQIVARTNVGPTPKGMALRDNRLLVTRFISPSTHAEVYDLNTNNLSLTRTIRINKINVPDDLDHGSGVPNYLSSIAFSPDGRRAYLAAVKQNVDNPNPDDDNTVRPMAAVIDLVNNRDLNLNPAVPDGTIDYDNAADPQFFSYLVNGDQVVVFQGNNNVRVFDQEQNTQGIFNTGFAPQASCATERTLYVKNFTDRSISAIDVAEWMHDGDLNPRVVNIPLIAAADDTLSADELAGLKLFYHSEQPEFGVEGYISCASCHMGGGQDGQVWNMTRFGEGLRNTLPLNGQSGTRFGNLHWTSNFDEVQDFIFQIINLNGGTADVNSFNATRNPLLVNTTGLSTKIDQLSAYISSLGRESLDRSVVKATANSGAAARGEQLFYDRNCASCHAPPAFTDGQRHDVGTGLLARTPRLTDLADTAPYLHDGRAEQLSDVFSQGNTHVNHAARMSSQQRSDLLTYLLSLDKNNFINDFAPFTAQPSLTGQFGTLIRLPNSDTDWEACAEEGDVCNVPEGATIRYGANGVYHYIHNQSGSIDCSNLQFGDAVPGALKQCDYFIPPKTVTTTINDDEICFPIKSKQGKVMVVCL